MPAEAFTLGRLEPTKSSVGGLRSVYIISSGYINPSTFTYGTSTLSDAIASNSGAASITAVKYDLKGTNTFEQTMTSSRENGTTYFEQKLALQLKKLNAATNQQLKLLAYSRPQMIVEDNNGNLFFAGLEQGMDATGGTVVTGTAMGDLSGYTIEFQGMEKVAANFLSGAITTVIGGAITLGT
jgi:hypothetical protein